MTNAEIIKKTMDYCVENYDMVVDHGGSAEKAFDRAYGAFMFTVNNLVDYNSPEGKELCTWWEDFALPAFRKLQ